jgi:hypothetical protein
LNSLSAELRALEGKPYWAQRELPAKSLFGAKIRYGAKGKCTLLLTIRLRFLQPFDKQRAKQQLTKTSFHQYIPTKLYSSPVLPPQVMFTSERSSINFAQKNVHLWPEERALMADGARSSGRFSL